MSVYQLPFATSEQVVTVQQDYDGDTPMDTHHLAPGQSRTFGRGGRHRQVDLRLAAEDRAVSRQAGEVTSHGDHWRISNGSPTKSYIVENTERLAGFVRVPPNTRSMLVPFETSRVRIPGGAGEHSFLVMAPAACGGVPVPGAVPELRGDPDDTASEHTEASSFRIDRWHTYYRVLVAYCEPQLLGADSGAVVIPTQGEVAERLGLSRAAVNAHVDYLLKTKFRVAPEEIRQGRDWRPQLLIDKALRFGLVDRGDLDVLDGGPAAPKTRG